MHISLVRFFVYTCTCILHIYAVSTRYCVYADDLMRDGLPEGTVVRQQRAWCMGRNSVVVGRAHSFKTCWDHCAEEYNDTVAIDGPPRKWFLPRSVRGDDV
jgi:hypothetical protein